MNRTLARLMQAAVLVFGIAALAFLLVEPHLEGRNVHSTSAQVYFHDPFLAFVYLGSIVFFAALYQAFRLLGQFAAQGAFPPSAPQSFRFIRNCALALVAFVAVGEVFIFWQESDDRAGGVAMGGLIGLGAIAVALAASACARRLPADPPRRG